MAVLLMNKTSTNGPWTGIEIFVSTPNCKINLPIMKIHRNVADRMGKVKSDPAPRLMAGFSDSFHINNLTGRIIYTSNEHYGNGISRFFYFCNNVIHSKNALPISRKNFY